MNTLAVVLAVASAAILLWTFWQLLLLGLLLVAGIYLTGTTFGRPASDRLAARGSTTAHPDLAEQRGRIGWRVRLLSHSSSS